MAFIQGYFILSGVPKLLMLIGIGSSLGAIAITLFLDIPMYIRRSGDDNKKRVRYLRVAEGLRDTFARRIQTNDWRVWKSETIWISSYFTIGFWLSIAMIFVRF